MFVRLRATLKFFLLNIPRPISIRYTYHSGHPQMMYIYTKIFGSMYQSGMLSDVTIRVFNKSISYLLIF